MGNRGTWNHLLSFTLNGSLLLVNLREVGLGHPEISLLHYHPEQQQLLASLGCICWSSFLPQLACQSVFQLSKLHITIPARTSTLARVLLSHAPAPLHQPQQTLPAQVTSAPKPLRWEQWFGSSRGEGGCQSSALAAVVWAIGFVPWCEQRAELGAVPAAGRARWGSGGTAGESYALCRAEVVHRHSLDGHYWLQRTWSCPCEYVLTWDLCGQHCLKNHSSVG